MIPMTSKENSGRSVANIAEANKASLKERHYVVCPHHPRYWGSFSPNKVASYRRRWGSDFCLVIAGDPSVADDFYAIPFGEVSSLFVEANAYPSHLKGGKIRPLWKIHTVGQHIFQFELAKGDERTRPKFNAKRWYANDRLLKVTAGAGQEFSTQAQLEEELAQAIESSESDSIEGRHARLQRAPSAPERVRVTAVAYRRNPDVIVEVLRRAEGRCERCRKPAPFLRAKDGTPYLEVHHWHTLADGGEDTLENAGAVCPNCHRELHYGLEV